MNMQRNKIYFVSDCHLGFPDYENSLMREKIFVKWLDKIKYDAKEIYLLGDIFDFWFEYKTVVPKGYVRLLGKLAEITDSGIIVHYFTGNHDMWIFDYFTKELNIKIYREPVVRVINDKKFFIGHGDGLGPGDKGYKFIKKVFSNKLCQWLFARLHPNFGLSLAMFFSEKSRTMNGRDDKIFLGEDKEKLILYSKNKLLKEHFDYFIFGHRHLPINLHIGDNSRYINLGDWINNYSYAVFDGNNLEIKYFIK
jgi:UDP-2,3-diacylglucosamine hydrolase